MEWLIMWNEAVVSCEPAHGTFVEQVHVTLVQDSGFGTGIFPVFVRHTLHLPAQYLS